MKIFKFATLGVVAFALSACSGLKVTSDWDPGVDFAQFETFYVLPEAEGGEPIDRFWTTRVVNSIAGNLEGKGMRRVMNESQADLAVGFQVSTQDRTSYQTVNTGWGGYGYGYYGWGGGISTSRTTEHNYTDGTLIIAIFDTSAKEMVWHGDGTKTLSNRQETPDEAQENLDMAVERIMETFPPGR